MAVITSEQDGLVNAVYESRLCDWVLILVSES